MAPQERDENRVRGMRIMAERQVAAVAAAAGADDEADAMAAAEAEMLPPSAAGP